MARRDELREWFSLTAADVPVWLAGAAVVAMRVVRDARWDWALAGAALALSLLGCAAGMKRDERLSATTNLAKKVACPLCVLLVLLVTYLNFTLWNG